MGKADDIINDGVRLLKASMAFKDALPSMMKIQTKEAFMSLISGLTFAWGLEHGYDNEFKHALLHIDIAKMIVDCIETNESEEEE